MSHIESGLKNQDAIQDVISDDAATAVLAVADGHGSELCFRSDTGSRLAVETAVELLRQFADTLSSGQDECVVESRARAILANELTQSWCAAVHRQVQSQP